jgi:hypothetical protein
MEIRRYLKEGMQEDGLCVLFGMEYETSDGDFLLFGSFEDLAAGLSARQLLKLVEESGGAAVAAHPFRAVKPAQEYIFREGFCTVVESINGSNAVIENLRVELWRKRYGLKASGGSDAHTLEELGRVVTRFDKPIRSRDGLIHALKNDQYNPEWNIFEKPRSLSMNPSF